MCERFTEHHRPPQTAEREAREGKEERKEECLHMCGRFGGFYSSLGCVEESSGTDAFLVFNCTFKTDIGLSLPLKIIQVNTSSVICVWCACVVGTSRGFNALLDASLK